RKIGRPMPIPQACFILSRVCEALDYAHRKRDGHGVPLGIVQRDISPQNGLVSFDGKVKLIDFGIAKAESRFSKTQAGILKGKFSYMSPEQVKGHPVDHRSDIFAAGVLLWEMLCGQKLFTGDSDIAVLEKVRAAEVAPPRRLNPSIPEGLEEVVLRSLAGDPRDRYQWASEMHDDLLRFTFQTGAPYGSRQLSEWLLEEFQGEREKEEARISRWLQVERRAGEVTASIPGSMRRGAGGGGGAQAAGAADPDARSGRLAGAPFRQSAGPHRRGPQAAERRPHPAFAVRGRLAGNAPTAAGRDGGRDRHRRRPRPLPPAAGRE